MRLVAIIILMLTPFSVLSQMQRDTTFTKDFLLGYYQDSTPLELVKDTTKYIVMQDTNTYYGERNVFREVYVFDSNDVVRFGIFSYVGSEDDREVYMDVVDEYKSGESTKHISGGLFYIESNVHVDYIHHYIDDGKFFTYIWAISKDPDKEYGHSEIKEKAKQYIRSNYDKKEKISSKKTDDVE